MQLYPSLIDRLANQYQSLQPIFASIDESRLWVKPQPNKWNIHDNMAHLVSYQPIFLGRVKQILVNENLSFDRYAAENDPAFAVCQNLDMEELISQMHVDREVIHRLIISLDSKQLDRMATHPKYGRMNIVQWTEFFLLHEAHHIFTIFQLAHDTAL